MQYLNSLPEVANKYKVDLESGEKVVFAAKMPGFSTETYRTLGYDAKFTMTNKRMIFDNGAGVWTVNVPDDVVSLKYIEKEGKEVSFLQRKAAHFSIMLNKEIVFDHGREKLQGITFFFKKKDMPVFGEIANNLNQGN